MKKRLLAALMAGAMALSMTACGGSSSGSDDSNAASGSDSAKAGSYKVGVVQLVQHVALDAATQGFQDKLTELVEADGGKVEFDVQNASGESANCSTIVNGFVSAGDDLIMANATAALQAAQAATSDIPVLGTSVTDYGTALGISDWTGKTGTNISGTTDLAPLDGQADMLKELGVKYVIIGHAERRQYFNETDEACGKKVQVALENGLRPILCVGESLTEREQDVTMEVIRKQIKIALQNVAVEDIKKVVIAYEPIWAIGTGKTATAEQANEVCSAIRDCLREKYGARAARGITIQYGGSMNAKNASELLAQPDVDGGLIGGASLKADQFAVIVEAATKG